jgi:hypothetical protein
MKNCSYGGATCATFGNSLRNIIFTSSTSSPEPVMIELSNFVETFFVLL